MANEEGIAQLENLRCVATANCSFGASSMPKLLGTARDRGDNPVRGNARDVLSKSRAVWECSAKRVVNSI